MMNLPNSFIDGYYLEWLSRKVGSENDMWEDVLRLLFHVAFQSLIPNDENRCFDGIALRITFQQDTNSVMTYYEESRPCSVLEMLIALAERMAFITVFDPADMENEDGVISNFWLMMSNLKLDPLHTGDNLKKVENFVMRNYDSNGVGGIFPLDNPRQDQREVELWYQMQEYIATEMY